MRFHQILPTIAVLGSFVAGAAVANPASRGAEVPANANPAPVGKVLAESYAAPIVSGRSASAHRKSRMHHVRSGSERQDDAPLADEGGAAE